MFSSSFKLSAASLFFSCAVATPFVAAHDYRQHVSRDMMNNIGVFTTDDLLVSSPSMFLNSWGSYHVLGLVCHRGRHRWREYVAPAFRSHSSMLTCIDPQNSLCNSTQARPIFGSMQLDETFSSPTKRMCSLKGHMEREKWRELSSSPRSKLATSHLGRKVRPLPRRCHSRRRC